MRPFAILFLLIFFASQACVARSSLADSIRIQYNIPELAFAVVSSDSVYELHCSGVQRAKTTFAASINDRFRIGSNTKAITGFIAAQLVHDGLIKWNTRFFDLFPELKATSNPTHHQLTLLHLLSFRTHLFPYTYTYAVPTENQFTGNEEEQRYQFTKWFFQQKPVASRGNYHPSNLGYVAAALMIEKVAGKSYQELVAGLGKELGINFAFGAPNVTDTLQPWGHDHDLNEEYPAANYKLNWLQAAGNISLSLPDYIRFIQLQLKGLRGQSSRLSKKEFEFLHFGLERFAVGWFWAIDKKGNRYSYNIGNPGTFLTKVYVYPSCNKSIIVFCNAQTDEANTGLDMLVEELRNKYCP